MSFNDLTQAAQKYFPKLQVKYKDQSPFMKFLGTILFFNKGFMTDYTTTIGNTIYIPNQNFMKMRPVSGAVVFMHELVHLYDQKRLGSLWFSMSYMMPQIFAIPAILLFLLSWKLALPVMLLCLAPTPAYFRMKYERRAYLSSVYTIQKLGQRLNFNPHLDTQNASFVEYFVDSSYYFMWPFKGIITADFTQAVQNVQAGARPYQDPVFDMLDDLVTKV
jgi:hypothetical protein